MVPLFFSSDQINISINSPLGPLELPGSDFFLTPPVLACRTMEIWLPVTDLDSPHGVLSWLITPFADQQQFRHLTIFDFNKSENDQPDQPLAKLIDKLIFIHLEVNNKLLYVKL